MKRTLKVTVATLLLSAVFMPTADAASKSKIDAYYKKIYRQMAANGNTDALNAMTYYDVEIKQALGKILDGKIKCDSKSKANFKAKAYDAYASEEDQLINGFYLGYCNAK